ncbi:MULTISPECIES: propionate catabolism operon regulatory protein PrpR [Paraburkholderia]|uniref:Propionate catabolism operon regulatory protein PrpR n=1 Tax=Paraburkholderia madseniana TaxID=2599607 RepID=A0AAP5ENX0_9BURK|nr:MULTISPECIES: propionate catabolism operon regulatory protein PrpR [Paraburkholderia]MCX4147038.1 propionate catabolism operon regulatory protein PrpR [Paraburkholderia madseniana]MDN7149981.1 propionate catabolism operon regulatory protein PrpR [Paraburkholderia sp. WS6]MDQ6408861.1 propionate catabolism operon regulatory protein PrpR [Paraburkholderia madseniana]
MERSSYERSVAVSTFTSSLANSNPGRPGVALVSISRLQSLCETVAPRYTERARFFSVREGYGAAVTALQAYVDAGSVDVVLAAGSNGAYLRDNLSVPVVMVKVNGFDVLSAITRATTTWPGAKIGLVLHETISHELADLSAWLNVGLKQRAYRSIDEVRLAVAGLAAEGCSVIIGPGMACDFAQQAGLESVFLYSLGAVEEAFERSVELARVSRQKESKRVRLNTIVAHLRDGVAAFDDAGQLEAVNPAMLDLLGLDRDQDVPAQLTRAVGPLLRETLEHDMPVEERIEQIGGRALIVNCVPILEQGLRSGSVVTVQDALVAQRIDRSLRTSQRPKHLVARHHLDDLIGSSAALERVRRLARAGAAHDATVLLSGESGTGKELVAQGIHNASRRRGNPFVAFNCAALPEGLIESELFGHEEGAFTGARRGGKPGLFEIAHTGTIFLDEIGEMPAALQSRLLRVLQEREVMKLGSGRATPVDVRVIAATHRDLHALVEQGAFRADLYFRLNLLQIELPPLRERRGDVAQLARHLLNRSALQYGLSGAALERVLAFLAPLFEHYAWPGNVRELENLLARAAIYLSDSAGEGWQDQQAVFPEFGRMRQTAADVHGAMAPAHATGDASGRRSPTREDVIRALEQAGGNRAAASRALGIGRTTLWRLMRD